MHACATHSDQGSLRRIRFRMLVCYPSLNSAHDTSDMPGPDKGGCTLDSSWMRFTVLFIMATSVLNMTSDDILK